MSDTEPPILPAPRDNPDLIGHQAAEAAFLEAFDSGRLAHAWLICGPQGIGKATLAFRVARRVLAQGRGDAQSGPGLFDDVPSGGGGTSLDLDPNHPVFRRVAAGGHADLMTVERGLNDRGRLRSEIVAEDARRVGAFMSKTPAEGDWRVVVVDAADHMNPHAANGVLKVLEEPPARALLLMVSHSPGRLLATIRSRCRRLSLQPLAGPVVLDLLARYRPDMDAEERRVLAGLGEGSIGRALALAEVGGLALLRDLVALLDSLPHIDVPRLHAFADKLGKAGQEAAFETVTDLLGWWINRLVVFASGASAGERPEAVPGERALMTRLARSARLDRWVEVWEKIVRLRALNDSLHLDRRQVVLNSVLALQDAVRA